MRYVMAYVVLCSAVVVGQELPKDTDEIDSLKVAQAEALVQTHEGGLSLNGLNTLSDEAAKALAQHKGGLSIERVTNLSPEAAKVLRQSGAYLPKKFQKRVTRAASAAGSLVWSR